MHIGAAGPEQRYPQSLLECAPRERFIAALSLLVLAITGCGKATPSPHEIPLPTAETGCEVSIPYFSDSLGGLGDRPEEQTFVANLDIGPAVIVQRGLRKSSKPFVVSAGEKSDITLARTIHTQESAILRSGAQLVLARVRELPGKRGRETIGTITITCLIEEGTLSAIHPEQVFRVPQK